MNGLSRIACAGLAAVLNGLATGFVACGERLVIWRNAAERGAGQADRQRLPQRRQTETVEFMFSREEHGFGFSYTAGIGRSASGRISEIFLDCHKLASQAADDARDAAICVSLALQHGMPITTLAHGVSRFEDGRPCSVMGRLADVLVSFDATRQPETVP